MCSSQSEPELASPRPPVRNKMKILSSDWVFDDQEDDSDEDSKKDNAIEDDREFVPSESVEKPRKRGRPRKSMREVKCGKKPKGAASAVKTKKKLSCDLDEVKSTNVAEVGSERNVNVINLEEWLTDEEVEEFEQLMDINDNQELSWPTVAKPDEDKSSYVVPTTTPVKEMNKMTIVGSLSPSLPVSAQDLYPAPGLSPLPFKLNVRSVQPRMLKPLSAGKGRISARPNSQQGVKSEQKMDVNDNEVSPEIVTSAKSVNTIHDLTNTTPEQDISLSSTSPHQSPSSLVSDQGDHQVPAPTNFPAKQLSKAVLPMPGPRSSSGQILVRPGQPKMPRTPRPPRPWMGRGSARPTGPRPAGARAPLMFPGPMSNPRSLVPMKRSATHPKSQYIRHPANSPQQVQFHSPSPSQSPNLRNLDVSIIREMAPPTRQGWVPPPGLSMVRVPATATESTLTISTLATALHQLGQVGGTRRSVQYSLTEVQIRALSTLGVKEEQLGGWQ